MAILMSRTQEIDDQRVSRDAESDGHQLDLEPDDIYHILQTRRRRDVIRYLHAADGQVRLRDLAERIAAWESETDIEHLTSSQRQRVYISLYQTHLPKLDTHGIIDYDKDRGTIESTPRVTQLVPYLTGLETATEHDPWPRRYAGTVGCCGLVLAAIAGGIVSLSWFVAAVSITVAVTAVTALHAYSVR
ncbi:hypothetical protein [Natronorubrum sp. A-ect3]|uniref:DUF7344 domain-containing protein n=1 Tax=Natronorubrum sp. A-ect3 TaxID=3242698 RepID=UPI00359DAD1B